MKVPKKQGVKVVQSSSVEKDAIVPEYGATFANQSVGDFYSLEELEQLEDDSMAFDREEV